jgi:hypothetical protein
MTHYDWPLPLARQIDLLQEEVLRELDLLDERILAVLRELGVEDSPAEDGPSRVAFGEQLLEDAA